MYICTIRGPCAYDVYFFSHVLSGTDLTGANDDEMEDDYKDRTVRTIINNFVDRI